MLRFPATLTGPASVTAAWPATFVVVWRVWFRDKFDVKSIPRLIVTPGATSRFADTFARLALVPASIEIGVAPAGTSLRKDNVPAWAWIVPASVTGPANTCVP